MNEATKLLVRQVKGKLKADGIKFQDYDGVIECLSHCVNKTKCINAWEEYIFKG